MCIQQESQFLLTRSSICVYQGFLMLTRSVIFAYQEKHFCLPGVIILLNSRSIFAYQSSTSAYKE